MIKLREKIQTNGVTSLSNLELLVVLLGNGNKHINVAEIAHSIVTKYPNLDFSLQNLLDQQGIGLAQGCKIMAATELGSRKLESDVMPQKFNSLSEIAKHASNKIGFSKQEKLLALFLDSDNNIIFEKIMFIGTMDSATVHPRDIIREALSLSATQILIAHNHYSGRLIPSENDKKLTQRIEECCTIMGIKFIDHLIFSKNDFIKVNL
ncbi:RadC family protein [Lactobacillus terrae]|uniref:RadC family protein n=1 Tax=Lactobacillus terrae TaxID=2269374 RepID=UPI000C1B6026|nr:DNA repair protein RadC [Lactobacillus terrae]